MHRNDRGSKPQERRKTPKTRGTGFSNEDYMDESNIKSGKQGRRQWQQERQLLKQLDPKLLDEYLLDSE